MFECTMEVIQNNGKIKAMFGTSSHYYEIVLMAPHGDDPCPTNFSVYSSDPAFAAKFPLGTRVRMTLEPEDIVRP